MRKVTLSFPWPLTTRETRELLSFAFQVSLMTYLGLYFLESLRPGFVTFFYNLDTFLWIAIIAGALSTLWPMVAAEAKTERPIGWKEYLWMGLLAIGTTVIVYDKTSTIGWLAKVIAPLSGLIVLGLSLLVYFDRDDDSNSAEK